jgi:Cu+-exporting ATPase
MTTHDAVLDPAKAAAHNSGRDRATDAGDAETIRIPVSGMTCAACSARVQRTLQKQPGVADANVNLMMKSATITFDPKTVSPTSLVNAIRDTGYGAELANPDQTGISGTGSS